MNKVVTILITVLALLGLSLVAIGTTLTVVVASDAEAANAADQLVYESLTKIDESGDVIPWLAASWDVSDDGLTWTFYLREGIYFQDDSPFTASDAIFSIGSEDSTRCEEIDDYKVQLNLESPCPYLPWILSLIPMISEEAENLVDIDIYALGTGPYTVQEWLPDQHLILRAVDDYWGWWSWSTSASFDEVRFITVPDPSTRLAMVQAGEADVMLDASPEQIYQAQGDPSLEVCTTDTDAFYALSFNLDTSLFQDMHVRKAISYIIDVDDLIEVAVPHEMGTICRSPFDHIVGYEGQEHIYDPDRARSLMEEAGWHLSLGIWQKNGETLEFSIMVPESSNYRIMCAQVIQYMLSNFGAIVEVEPVAYPVFLNRLYQREYVAAIVYEPQSDIPYPDLSWLVSDSSNNTTGYSNPEVDEVVERLSHELDRDNRQVYYEMIGEELARDMPCLFLVHPLQSLIVQEDLEAYCTPWTIAIRNAEHPFGEPIPLFWPWTKAYWRCVAWCIEDALERDDILEHLCAHTCAHCLIDPSKITCASCLACVGGSILGCVIGCAIPW